MSSNEKEYDLKIEPEKHIIVRLDGHKFSKFTKQFIKPFDEVIGKAMELTSIDLLTEYNFQVGYFQSDEMSFCQPSLLSTENPDWNHDFNGRVQKMSSLMASFATVRFNFHLKKLHLRHKETEYLGPGATFDCRVFGVNTMANVFEEFFSRMRSAERNSKSSFAHAYFKNNDLQNLNGSEMIAKCIKYNGKNWNDLENKYKYGVVIKKAEEKQYVDNEWFQGYAIRHPVRTVSRKFEFTQECMDLVTSKYLL